MAEYFRQTGLVWGLRADGGVRAVNDGRATRDRGLQAERPARKSADADRWFDLELNRIYSDVINEPLPRDFLELVAKLGRKKSTQG